MLNDQVEIQRLAEISEKSPAIASLIEAVLTPAGKEALAAAAAWRGLPPWYVRVWQFLLRKNRGQ